ncbi:hypothetical protein ABPG72_019515 [Tetrahymena utriculariae]
MFKVAKNKKLLASSGLAFKSNYKVSNPTVINNFESRNFKNKKNLYNVVAKRSGDVVYSHLNCEYKQNTLDTHMIKEITRFLESYEIDSSIRAVFLENSKEAGVFSKGTDFKFLMKKIAEKEPHKAFDYLRELYDFAILIGKYNKPLLININGFITGSAASIFTRAPFALGSKNTKWRLNETSLGYIPDAGASYYLSRLNMELGTFLALTGWQIDGYDLSRSGIAFERMFVTHQNIEENWKVAHKKHDQETTSEDLYGLNKFIDLSKQLYYKETYFSQLNEELYNRIHKQGEIYYRNENKRLAMAEILYKHQMQDRANLGFKPNDLFNRSHEILNRLLHYEQCVMFDLGLENIEMQTSGTVTSLSLFTIARCFSANSIEEIIERLREEDTHFSRACIKSLESKSPLALKLTFKLLREGINSSWKECFEREFRVACRRLLDNEVMRCIQSEIVEEARGFKDWDYKVLSQISKDQVESYFRPLVEEKRFEGVSEYHGDLKDNCLYPTKDFYRDYPDTVRYYLNQDNLRDVYQRNSQIYDVGEFLQSYNINSKSPAINIADLREKFYLMEKLNRKKTEKLNRLSSLSGSEFSIKNFYEVRKAAIDSLFSNKQLIEQRVEEFSAQVFEDFRNERLQQIKKISQVAAVEKKQDFFMKLRQKIIDERLVESEQLQDITIREYPGLQYPLFFPFDNKDNIIEAHNPYVKTLFKDVLNEIKVESRGTLIKNYSFDLKEIESIMEEKEFGKKLIDRLHLQYSDKVNWFNKAREQYEIRYGDHRGQLVDQWYEKLIEAGYKVDGIREILQTQTNDQVKQIIQNNITDNLKDYIYEFLSDLQVSKSIFEESENTQNSKELAQEALKISKEGFNSYSNLISLENGQKHNIQSNFALKPHEQAIELFKKYISHDEELKETLSILLESQQSKSKNSIIEKTRQEMLKLLTQIIQSKLEQIYGKNNYKSCLVTENGEKYYQFDHAYMTRFDNYIAENLEFDIQQYLSTHTLFMFGALGLQRLENLFRRIYNATRKAQKGDQESAQESAAGIIQILKDYGLEVNSTEELEELTNYLNNLTSTFASLYVGYKNHLIFSEDKALELQNRAKFVKEREQDELSFSNYAIMAYEQKEKFIEQLSALGSQLDEKEFEYKVDFTDQIKSIQRLIEKPLRDGENKEQRIQVIKYQLQKLDDYKLPKKLITGFVLYAEKLDRLTQTSIHGKTYYVPEKLQINPKDAQIPEIFEDLDSRMTVQQWLDAKLKIFIKKIFNARYQQEKILNHHDLLMLDYEISKFLMPESLKQSMYEELDRDMETLRICREYQVSERSKGEAEMQEFLKKKQLEVGKIRNPKAVEKLNAFRIWREQKFANRDPTAAEFEQIMKIEGELILESTLAPYGQIETDKEIEKAYLHLLDIQDLSDIDTTRITKEKTLIEEYRLSIDHLKNQIVTQKGDHLYDDINLFIKQISV